MKCYSLIVEMPNGQVLVRNKQVKKLAEELNIGMHGLQKQLKKSGIFVCSHTGTKVSMCCIEIAEYRRA